MTIIRKQITVITFLCLLTSCAFRYNKFALYGEAPSQTDGAINICFDRFGDMYPDIATNNKALRMNYAALSLHYVGDEEFSKKLSERYHVKVSSFDSVQRLIIKEKAKQINEALAKEKIDNITIIMVGYNNSYYQADPKLNLLKEKIQTFLQKENKTTLIIKLFWDGTNKDIATGITYGNSASYFAGLGLRELLKNLHCDKINLISHSLGANLVCETLFNQTTKVTDYDDVKSELIYDYNLPLYPTPKQKITAAIVAPAVPGTSTFLDYCIRSGIKEYIASEDKYRFIVGYNKHDMALKKIFGGSLKYHFSATSLGCDIDQCLKVQALLNSYGKTNNFKILDFSYDTIAKQIHKAHGLETYLEMKQYDELIKLIYSDEWR